MINLISTFSLCSAKRLQPHTIPFSCYKSAFVTWSSNKYLQIMEVALMVNKAGIRFRVYNVCTRQSVHEVTTGFQTLSCIVGDRSMYLSIL